MVKSFRSIHNKELEITFFDRNNIVFSKTKLNHVEIEFLTNNQIISYWILPRPHLLMTPSGTAITMTSTMPIAKPIQSPIKHRFEQNLERTLKFQNNEIRSYCLYKNEIYQGNRHIHQFDENEKYLRFKILIFVTISYFLTWILRIIRS
jgi:hypothetical protein